ncbi:306_t:CDS:2, partial [Racocetra fulgida]
MSRLLRHDELGIYCRHRELWMVEEDYQTIPLSHILRPISIWLEDVSRSESYDFHFHHHHSSEYIITPNTPPLRNMKTFKFMIDIYNDDFGTYRNVYHSLGGIYIQIDNMPLELRQQLKNHFIVGFVPFGGHFDDAMRPLLQELHQLEKGVVMSMNSESVWVIASIRLVTADLPQVEIDGLRCIITDQRLQPLLVGWYITDDLHPENISNE